MGLRNEALPTGTVTFLFSDIEGSTGLIQRLDPGTYREVLEEHHRLLRTAFSAHGGVERGTQGDSFLVVFRDAPSAVAAAVDAQRALARAVWPEDLEIRVRMGLHTGEGILGADDYVGIDVNRAARIAAAAHGGQVLLSEPTRALAERSLPAGLGLRDVGQHRFKGLEQPERVHQLTIGGLRTEFPPIRSLSPTLTGAPARTSSFLGRDREVDALLRLMDGHRLITLVGSGGTGKSSLAVEVAARAAARFADGAVFVALESVARAELVGSAVVAGLGLRDPTSRPAREQLLDNLAGREILLVLDNFEHVLEAASLVGELIAAAAGMSIIATSRAPLRLAEEQVFPVVPLSIPTREDRDDPVRLGSVDSVRLFVERAQRVQPDFLLDEDNAAAISDICRLVDGLPLGIEIAAARTSLLGPAGVRDRLARKISLPGSSIRDVPTRQQTLGAAIAWSHDLVDEPGRRLFRRLSVFAGGFRIDELETVCPPSMESAEDVIEVLARLVDHSLVIASHLTDGVRYEMLGTVRDFASERFAADPDRDDIERRHALAYLAFAEGNAQRLERGALMPAFRLIALERDNLRATVHWAVVHGNPEVGLRVATALARFWWLSGQLDEGRITFDTVFAIPGADAPTVWRMRALEGAGLIYYYGADNDRAVEAYQAQLGLARQLGDRRGETDARFNFMFTQDARGRIADGLAMIDEIAASYRALGDERSLARTVWVRSNLMASEGRLAEAQALLEEAVAKSHALGDVPYEMQAASGLALGGLLFGDRNTAARWFPVTLALVHKLGDTTGITIALPIFAAAAMEFVGPSEAATLLGAYEAMCRRYGTRMPRGLEQVVAGLATRERAMTALGSTGFEAAVEAGQAMTLDDAFDYLDDTIGRIKVPAGEPA